jgi:hypothetical protein
MAQTVQSQNITKNHTIDSFSKTAIRSKDSTPSALKSDGINRIHYLKLDSSYNYKKIIPSVKGRIGLESYYASFQNPRVLNEPHYIRLSGNTSVSMAGIPLLVDFYRTTENQSFYNSNYFKVKFDHQTYIDGIKKQWSAKLQEASSSANVAKYKSSANSKLASELEQQRGRIQSLQSTLEGELSQKQDAFIENYQFKKDSMLLLFQDSITQVAAKVQDSLQINRYSKARYSDSIQLERLKNDTHNLAEKLRLIEKKRSELNDARKQLDSTISADTAKYNYYKALLEDPEKNAHLWLNEKGFSKQLVFLSRIKDLETGVINPLIHTYSISGVSMKGLQGAMNLGKSNLKLVGGKAIIADFSTFNRSNNKYERLFIGIGFDTRLGKNLKLTLFGHFATDPKEKFTKENRIASQNGVAGIEMDYTPGKLPKFIVAYSNTHFSTRNRTISHVSYIPSGDYSIAQQSMSTSAYKTTIEKTLGKQVKIEAWREMVGPKYKNLGNPFMRVNFLEHSAKIKFELFKNQINASLFYKKMRDNPLNISEVVNSTSGYGFSMSSRFKNRKLPNFMTSISPYEQGNNHPDSLFRVNSKFSVITAGITYRTGRKYKYFVMAFGSQSRMQFSDTFSAVVRTATISQDLSIGSKISLGYSSTFTRTFPSVDSTQANTHQGRVSYRFSKSNSIMISGFSSQFLNGAYRKGASLAVSISTHKHTRVTLKAGIDHYHKLWGIENKQAYWGACRFDFVF